MQQPRVSLASAIDGVGVPWLLRSERGERVVEHGGNLENLYLSSFAMVPDRGVGVTTMATSVGGRALGAGALEYVFDNLLGVAARPVSEPLPLDPATVGEYVGVYAAGQWDLVVEHAGGELSVRMHLTDIEEDLSDEVRATFEQPTPVVLVAPDVIAPAAAPARSAGDFVRDGSGGVAFLRYGLRLARKVS